jgi:membrane-bound metal-dependent hydrolase YbcI (DUF457 family)
VKAHSHAVLGAAAWLGLTTPAATHAIAAWRTPRPIDLAAGALATAGAALLPDLDTPHSSAAHAAGLPGTLAARVLGKLTGGHRHATHSLLFAAVAGALAWAAGLASPWAGLVLLCALIALAVKGLVPAWRDFGAAAALLTAGAWWWHADVAGWLPLAAALGCLAHALADALTVEGVPLLWPWPRYLSVPLVGETGSIRETAAVALAGVFVLWVALRALGLAIG